jgi:hypothetical protein
LQPDEMIQQPLRQLVTPANFLLQDALCLGSFPGQDVYFRQDCQGIWIGWIVFE